MRVQNRDLASAEGDDAPDRIVRRNADRDAIAWHHLDSKAAHSAAQLCQHLVSLIALHTVKTAAVNRHDRALHVDQIILAQLLPFPVKDCAIFWMPLANSSVQFANRPFHPRRVGGVIIAGQ